MNNYIFPFLCMIVFLLSCKEGKNNSQPSREVSTSDTLMHNGNQPVTTTDTIKKDEIDFSQNNETNTDLSNTKKPEIDGPSVHDPKVVTKHSPKPENSERPVIKPEKPVSLPDDRIQPTGHAPKVETTIQNTSANIILYQQLLTAYVDKNGKVNYNGLKKDLAKLENYTSALSDDPLFESGNKKEKLALWINTYNAYTLLLVAKNYPIQSIRDVYNGKPWDEVWIRIGKKKYSLNQIENDIIRPQFGEPRIHFVLNCAAKSCPPLLNKALTAQNLEGLMSEATKSFVLSSENELSSKKIAISSIFDWYKEDFGNVISFLNQYSNVKIESSAKISYKKYDWSLNKS